MTLMKKHEFSSGAIVFHPSTDYILMVRSKVGRRGWGFPKGHIHQNEDPVETAKREVEEETGLSRDCLSLISPLKEVYQTIRYPKSEELVYKKTRFFVFHSSSDEITMVPEDMHHDRAAWVSWNNLTNLRHRYSYVLPLAFEAKNM